MEKLNTAQEISEYLRIKPSTVYKLSAEDKLPHIRIGGKVLFRISDIEKFVNENTNYPPVIGG